MPVIHTPTYFNVVGGLNTESSPLNMPATDAKDLLNIRINVDGSVQRRKGVDFIGAKSSGGFYETSEDNFLELNNGFYAAPAIATATFSTLSSSGVLEKYVFAHVGMNIYIYKYEDILSLREVSTPFQKFDLDGFMNPKGAFHKTLFIQDKDKFFMINKFADVGFFSLDMDTNAFQYAAINITIRDITGASPKVDAFVNSGGDYYQCIKNHVSQDENKPGEGELWRDFWIHRGVEFDGKLPWKKYGTITESEPVLDEFGNPVLDEYGNPVFYRNPTLRKIIKKAFGKTSAEAYIKYREIAKGNYSSNVVDYIYNIYGIDDEALAKPRFSTGCFASGRLWLSGIDAKPNTILFSQTIRDDRHYGRMYQEADPLNRDDNEIVDTDGGTITLAGAEQILSIAAFKAGVIVFANNGVWYVFGSNNSFKANDFSVVKISGNGIVGEQAWCIAEELLIYFGENDVYAISPKAADDLGTPATKSIGTKIISFYNTIPLYEKASGKAVYNTSTKRISFTCNFQNQAWSVQRNVYKQNCQTRDILIFDLRLQAWYKYSLEADETGDKVAIGDMIVIQEGSFAELFVVDNGDVLIESEDGSPVTATGDAFKETSLTNLCVFFKKNDAHGIDFAFGTLEGSTLRDFSLSEEDSSTVHAHLYTSHQVLGDVIHSKMVPYLTTIFKRVETGVLDEDTGLDVNPGGCFLRVSWDWAVDASSSYFGSPFQTYIPYKYSQAFMDGRLPGVEVVTTKHRLRGFGDAFQLRYESDEDKDFHLYGWQLVLLVDRKV